MEGREGEVTRRTNAEEREPKQGLARALHEESRVESVGTRTRSKSEGGHCVGVGRREAEMTPGVARSLGAVCIAGRPGETGGPAGAPSESLVVG